MKKTKTTAQPTTESIPPRPTATHAAEVAALLGRRGRKTGRAPEFDTIDDAFRDAIERLDAAKPTPANRYIATEAAFRAFSDTATLHDALAAADRYDADIMATAKAKQDPITLIEDAFRDAIENPVAPSTHALLADPGAWILSVLDAAIEDRGTLMCSTESVAFIGGPGGNVTTIRLAPERRAGSSTSLRRRVYSEYPERPSIRSTSGAKIWLQEALGGPQFSRPDGGPTIVLPNGTKVWAGRSVHRADGPAIEIPSTALGGRIAKAWVQHGTIARDGAPAVILGNGTCAWLSPLGFHRTDGPAIEFPRAPGMNAFYVNGLEADEAEVMYRPGRRCPRHAGEAAHA